MQNLTGSDIFFLVVIGIVVIVGIKALVDRKNSKLPTQSPNYDTPYEQGKRAAQSGAGLSNNKYDEGTPESNDWIAGYHSIIPA